MCRRMPVAPCRAAYHTLRVLARNTGKKEAKGKHTVCHSPGLVSNEQQYAICSARPGSGLAVLSVRSSVWPCKPRPGCSALVHIPRGPCCQAGWTMAGAIPCNISMQYALAAHRGSTALAHPVPVRVRPQDGLEALAVALRQFERIVRVVGLSKPLQLQLPVLVLLASACN